MALESKCLECGDKLIGRADKKFCSDQCRNAYNNRNNSDANNLVRNINNTLRKNRRILVELNPKDKTKTSRDKLLSKGSKKIIISDYGWKICPLICYDIRFPVFCRNQNEYDLLIFLSSWPSKRIKAWDILLQARAIENQAYTAGVNRVGKDKMYKISNHKLKTQIKFKFKINLEKGLKIVDKWIANNINSIKKEKTSYTHKK